MPRKKPEDLKSKAAPAAKSEPAAPVADPVAAPVAAPVETITAPAAQNTGYHPADINGDGRIDAEEETNGT